MAKKMLIDATHPEETRVVVVDGSRVEEFDFESLNKRQLAGNIYLAKVTRVEPSLQAAFVDYGGNRHGFLAFSEIHPDYYQIPVSDREALLAAEAEAAAESEDEDETADANGGGAKSSGRKRRSRSRSRRRRSRKGAPVEATAETESETNSEESVESAKAENAPEAVVEDDAEPAVESPDASEADQAEAQSSNAEETQDIAEEAVESPVEEVAETAPAEAAPIEAPEMDAESDTAADETPIVAETSEEPEISADDTDAGESEPSEDHIEEPADDSKAPPRSMAESAGTEKDATLTGDAPADEAQDDEAEAAPADVAMAEASETPSEDASVEAVEVASNDAEDAPTVETDASDAEESVEAASTDDASTEDSPVESGEAASADSGADASFEAQAENDRSDDDADNDNEDESDDDEADAETPEEPIESVGASDEEEEVRPRRRPVRRYKIQEVIKRRQILLVQVVKEERGNKGAALTTYISIAGRYCVLMPNTARGGGISRKITNASDRKRLKEIAGGLEVPKGMGLIVRTAGAERTKSEIKRDYDFLLRQWDLVRDMTLKSVAPTLIYEEGSLIKRSIRDLYSREISAVQVEGEAGYREAKDYMKMLIPSHAKNVQPYRDPTPLFIKHQVEGYLNSMFNPVVQLKSGGYIVIGVTEALVAIDVNSGRSTKEQSIENTALKTNLEAAEEVARQLRLRDLAGLIVIDFIDMEESRNNRAVEKRFKERLKNDRARLQVGRISGFGLLEMSRQRLRPGMLEATTTPCPHCHGQGIVRSDENLALSILRQVEEEGVKRRSSGLKVIAPVAVANYLINKKRDSVLQVESRYGVRVEIEGDPVRIGTDFSVERTNETLPSGKAVAEAVTADPALMDVEPAEVPTEAAPANDDDKSDGKKRRRRRGRRGGRRKNTENQNGEATAEAASEDQAPSEEAAPVDESAPAGESRLTVKEDGPFGLSVEAATESSIEVAPPLVTDDATSDAPVEEASVTDAPLEEADSVAELGADQSVESDEAAADSIDEAVEIAEESVSDEAASADAETDQIEESAAVVEPVDAEEAADEPPAPAPVETAPPKPKRTGWWSIGRG